MSISDVLLVLSILVAIFSIISANNKRLLLYKFSWKSVIVGCLIFIVINYLVFFDSLMLRGLVPDCFLLDNGLKSNTWAYIVTIVTLLMLGWYILKSPFFPKKNNDIIIQYYTELIENNFELLCEYISRYHKKNISKIIEISSAKGEKSFLNRKSAESNSLDQLVLQNILINDDFIRKCASKSQTFFLEIFSNIAISKIEEYREYVQSFFYELVLSKNVRFANEVLTLSYSIDDFWKKAEKSCYCKFIFKENFKYADDFEIVIAIGEAAVQEVSVNNSIFTMEPNEWNEGTYMKTSCVSYVNFFVSLYYYLISYCLKYGMVKDEFCNSAYHPYNVHFKWICDKMASFANHKKIPCYAKIFLDNVIEKLKSILEFLCENSIPYFVKSIAETLMIVSYDADSDKYYNKDSIKRLVGIYYKLYGKYGEKNLAVKTMSLFMIEKKIYVEDYLEKSV